MFDYEMTKGRIDGAREMLEKLEKIMPDTAGVVGGRGMLLAMSGDVEQARQVIDKLEKSYENVGVMPNYVAYIYYVLGDLDKAFLWLGKAVEAHSLIPHNIRYSSVFSGLRKDPRYRQLLIRNGLNPENVD
jgi:Flp pilus assembly protein TadD